MSKEVKMFPGTTREGLIEAVTQVINRAYDGKCKALDVFIHASVNEITEMTVTYTDIVIDTTEKGECQI